MQLASIHTPSPSRHSFVNLQVVRAGLVEAGIQDIVHDSVNLDHGIPRTSLGGTRVTERRVDGVSRRSTYEMFRRTSAERDAAAGLSDAIEGSGLIALLQPTTGDIGVPAAGRTRIYVDRRAWFVEFETGRAPVAAQAVLDALDSYRALAA